MRLPICFVSFLVVAWSAFAHPLLRLPLTASRNSRNNVCPDGTSECRSGTTCCKLENGSYSCCPFEHAVCCTDGVCCPHGHTCNRTMCTNTTRNGASSPAIPTSAPHLRRLDSETCPDGNICDNGTCCQQSSGVWGCCSFEKAVCCADKLHCCPEEFDCDTILHTCIRVERIAPTVLSNTADYFSSDSVKCPDSSTHCPGGNTCCKSTSSSYTMCCPLPNASCCADDKHCCPDSFQCVLSNGTYTCSKKLFDNQWLHRKLS